jgi:trk system potassium uptake protein TrkA
MIEMNIIIIGGGIMMYFLARFFTSAGNKVTLISKNAEDAKDLATMEKVNVVKGDATLPEVLEDAGAAYANVIIAITPNDPDNLVICQIAKKEFKVKKTLAFVNDPRNVEVFKSLGVDQVVSIVNIMSSLVQQQITLDEISSLTPVEEGKVIIMETQIEADDNICESTLNEFDLPEDALIGCVIRNGKAIIPRGNTKIIENDRLIILLLPDIQTKVLKVIKKG